MIIDYQIIQAVIIKCYISIYAVISQIYCIIKIKLPSSENECISVYAEMDDDADGEIKTSSFTGLSYEDEDTWFEVELN